MLATILGTIAGLLVLAASIALLALLIRRIRSTGRVTVVEQYAVPAPPAAVDHLLWTALGGVPGPRVTATGVGRYAVVLRRTPPWLIVPVWLTMPLGLILLLLVKEDVIMDVSLYEAPDGSVIHLSGRSEKNILARVRDALAPLAGGPSGETQV
jgi:hypothetical protein